MIPSSAYLLVFHGSRDRQAHLAASNLVSLLNEKFRSKTILAQYNYIKDKRTIVELGKTKTNALVDNPLIEVAALELAPLPLNESLVNFAARAVRQGYQKIKVIPLFLAPGIHVREDIPREITLATQKLNNQLTIELSSYVGKYSAMFTLLSRRFAVMSGQGQVLVAHGSRLPQVAEYCQELASQLDAELAYWSTDPSLRQQITNQIVLGHQRIAILPYFLFPGKITQAIATEVAQLQQENPQVKLILDRPLGATKALAELIFEAI